ncbi:MAG: asparagine synthase (glutamine-hydrolyzing) [Eubacteriales bacterium]
MCGICGFISNKNISIEELRIMNDTMYHRGPNDSGEEIYPMKGGYALGFAQRRLSILDLSPLGHQPMHSKDKRISVVYNGEIYNFGELREQLSDYTFLSTCDTEVIIAAYLKWGIDCISKFNGMFAIALFDRDTEELFLVRDRIGKKPLYYWKESGQLVFASELKPIMAYPHFTARIQTDLLPRYLYQQYINGPESIYEHVYKLQPGAILRYKEGEITTWKYWEVGKAYEEMVAKPVTDYGQAKEELKDKLKKAVASRMIADVPLGAFLSGGYDSSLMTAIAQEHADTPVKTFTIGFHDKQYNEAKYAKEVADYLGTNHTEIYISEKEMFEMVDSIPQYYDEPFADSSQISTMLVSQLAREQVTVALSGDGGDEFFCGYNMYEKLAKAQRLDGLGAAVHGICHLPGLKQAQFLEKLPFSVKVIAGNRNIETKTQFGVNNYITRANQMVANSGMNCQYEIEKQYPVKNWQIRRMLLDMDTYLPGDILCKVDRASMKYSLESRCPILDKEVMEYSFRLPHEFKYKDGVKKRILKDIAYDYIPRELLERKKVGFAVPLDRWMRGPLKEQLLDYSEAGFLKKQGLFDDTYVPNMIHEYLKSGDGGAGSGANYSRLCWAFLVFQQWYQRYGD